MIRYTTLSLVIASGLVSVKANAADEDMGVLLKELSKQVAELKSHSAQSDARIRELENNLEKEREENRQLTTTRITPKVATTTTVTTPIAETVAIEPRTEVKPAVTLGDTKGTFKIPGTDTSLGFGGFVKLDVIENSVSSSADANALGDVRLAVADIAMTNRGENSQLAFNARESRFWLKSFTPSKWGDINTYLEMDLYGSSAAYVPNLRHAYGSFGNLLAGQTWSTFVNELSLADTLDYGGSVGAVKLRQPLIRWTQPFTVANQSLEFQAAAEAPTSSLWDTTTTNISRGSDRYPDMVARLNYKPSWGNLSLAGLGRQIRYTNNANGAEHGAWGGAVSLAGKINVFTLDNIRFSMNYGSALGRYLSSPLEDAAFTGQGVTDRMNLVDAYSGVFAYQHWWDKTWRSSVAYSVEKADQLAFVNAARTEQAQSVHANLLWSPLPQATLGMEYIYGSRDLIDGRTGNLSRAQFSAKYNF